MKARICIIDYYTWVNNIGSSVQDHEVRFLRHVEFNCTLPIAYKRRQILQVSGEPTSGNY
jgi:hypothetical protein